MTLIPLANPQTAPELRKPCRCYSGATDLQAQSCAERTYRERGWPLPEVAYLVRVRGGYELYLPVDKQTTA